MKRDYPYGESSRVLDSVDGPLIISQAAVEVDSYRAGNREIEARSSELVGMVLDREIRRIEKYGTSAIHGTTIVLAKSLGIENQISEKELIRKIKRLQLDLKHLDILETIELERLGNYLSGLSHSLAEFNIQSGNYRFHRKYLAA
jgi:hypothetical protein